MLFKCCRRDGERCRRPSYTAHGHGPQAGTAAAARSRRPSTVNSHHGRADRILAARSPASAPSQTMCQVHKCSGQGETLGATAEISTSLCNNGWSLCKNGARRLKKPLPCPTATAIALLAQGLRHVTHACVALCAAFLEEHDQHSTQRAGLDVCGSPVGIRMRLAPARI